jgi:TRAP-type C4-dicarboxylate transport system permease small subunit
MAGMLAVVAGSIAARLLSNATGGALNLQIPGAIEIARYALLVLVLTALPGAALRGLVRVDLLIDRLPAGVARLLDRVWTLALASFAGLCAVRFAQAAWVQQARGDATQDLGLPLWTLTGFAALAMAVLMVTSLWHALRPAAKTA